jgi:hypothetical protein
LAFEGRHRLGYDLAVHERTNDAMIVSRRTARQAEFSRARSPRDENATHTI